MVCFNESRGEGRKETEREDGAIRTKIQKRGSLHSRGTIEKTKERNEPNQAWPTPH